MKIIYAFVVLFMGTVAAQAQMGATQDAPSTPKQSYNEFRGNASQSAAENRVTIWQDDFSTPANWTIAHDGTFVSDFEIGPGLVSPGQYGTPAILSTTATNGYAMYNSDGFNNSAGTAYEQAHITTASPIDLTAYPNVILQFETQYRRFTDEQTYLIVSTDGVTWPTLDDPTLDISTLPGVYKVWEDGELTTSISPGNPTTRSFNISSIAGGASQVWVRLQFTGIWGYAWYVDDIQIYEQFQHDAKLFSSYVSSTGTGEEYGRMPQAQVPAQMNVGCLVKNLGFETMTNVNVTIALTGPTGGPVTTTVSQAELLAGDTMFVDDYLTVANDLGVYNVSYAVTSDQSATEGDLTNNAGARYYEVTSDLYTLDAVDLHPTGTEVYTSLGTNSFTGNPDELMLLNYYQILEAATAYGAEVLLATGTVAGAEILFQVHDTTDVFADVIDNPLGGSDTYVVTDLDVSNGFVTVPFIDPLPLDVNAYYLSVALFSNGNTNDVRILDDVTVPQPSAASMIYLPSDGVVYSNGNAHCVRMSFDQSLAVSNAPAKLEGINVYPNPATNGIINITSAQHENLTLEVFNNVGSLVQTQRFYMNTTADLSSLAKGTYTVRVKSPNAVSTQLVTVQ